MVKKLRNGENVEEQEGKSDYSFRYGNRIERKLKGTRAWFLAWLGHSFYQESFHFTSHKTEEFNSP